MANKKISDYTADATPASGDLVETLDISDTTMAATGTNKKVTAANLITKAHGLSDTTVVGVASGALAAATTTGTGSVVRATSPALSTPTGIVKGDVGLGNVDNTSNATERAATAALTNKTLTSGTNTFPTFNQDTTGKSAKTDALNSASTVVNVAAATAPSTGQVLTATDSTHATWQTPSGGGGATPTFHWFNPCNDGTGSTQVTGTNWVLDSPGSEVLATNALRKSYIGAVIINDYANHLFRSGGWAVGHVAYWHWNPFMQSFTTAGSSKVMVGDDYADTGTTHTSTGSYGFYTNYATGKMYAFVYSGTTETRTDITSALGVNSDYMATFTAVYTPSTDVKFYYDGALVATISTNLPSTSNAWTGTCGGNVETTTSSQLQLRFGYHGIYINLF